jgi:hypothetical protein
MFDPHSPLCVEVFPLRILGVDDGEICHACDEPITYEEIYDGEGPFVTPDDRAFHLVCWNAWLLDNNEL